MRQATNNRDVLDELSTYMTTAPTLGATENTFDSLRLMAYLIVQHLPATGGAASVPLRTLILTQSTVYIVDEDYARWPPPFFATSYDYRQRPPYRVISQRAVGDVLGVELPSARSCELSLVFETQGLQPSDFQTSAWDLVCARPEDRSRFVRQLRTMWRDMFASDLRVIEV